MMSRDVYAASTSRVSTTSLTLRSSLLRRTRSADEIPDTDPSEARHVHVRSSFSAIDRGLVAQHQPPVSISRVSASAPAAAASRGASSLPAQLLPGCTCSQVQLRLLKSRSDLNRSRADPSAHLSPLAALSTFSVPSSTRTDTGAAGTSRASSSVVGSYRTSPSRTALVCAGATREDHEPLMLRIPAKLREVGEAQSLPSVSHTSCGELVSKTLSNVAACVYPRAFVSFHTTPSSKTGPLSSKASGRRRGHCPLLPVNLTAAVEALMVDPDAPRPHRSDLRHPSGLRPDEEPRTLSSSTAPAPVTPRSTSTAIIGRAPPVPSAGEDTSVIACVTVAHPSFSSLLSIEPGMPHLLTPKESMGGPDTAGGGSVTLLDNSTAIAYSPCSSCTPLHDAAAASTGVPCAAPETPTSQSLCTPRDTRGGAQCIEVPLCLHRPTAAHENPLEHCSSVTACRRSPLQLLQPSPLSPHERVGQTPSVLSTQSASGQTDAPYTFTGLLDWVPGSSVFEEEDDEDLGGTSRGVNTSRDTVSNADGFEETGSSQGDQWSVTHGVCERRQMRAMTRGLMPIAQPLTAVVVGLGSDMSESQRSSTTQDKGNVPICRTPTFTFHGTTSAKPCPAENAFMADSM